MFKDRLAKWGFRKYLNSEAVLDIARTQVGGDAAGRKVREYIRPGRGAVKSTTVKRYLDRNQHLREEWQAAAEGKKRVRVLGQTRPPTPPRTLAPPDTLRVVEQAIKATKELLGTIPFKLGSDDGLDWLHSQEKALCFSNILFFATRYLAHIQNGEVVRLLNHATTALKPIIEDQYASFTLHFLLRVKARDIHSITELTMSQAAGLSKAIYGERHPHFRLWECLLQSLRLSNLEDTTNQLRGVCFEGWRSLVLAGARQLDVLSTARSEFEREGVSEQIVFLSALRKLSGKAWNAQPRLLYAIAWTFVYLGEFEEARVTMQKLQPYLLEVGQTFPGHHFQAHLEAEQGHYHAAAGRLKRGLDTAFHEVSWDRGLVQMYYIELGTFFTIAGDDQRAKETQDRFLAYSAQPKLVELNLPKKGGLLPSLHRGQQPTGITQYEMRPRVVELSSYYLPSHRSNQEPIESVHGVNGAD